jgi:hypothetical protein
MSNAHKSFEGGNVEGGSVGGEASIILAKTKFGYWNIHGENEFWEKFYQELER